MTDGPGGNQHSFPQPGGWPPGPPNQPPNQPPVTPPHGQPVPPPQPQPGSPPGFQPPGLQPPGFQTPAYPPLGGDATTVTRQTPTTPPPGYDPNAPAPSGGGGKKKGLLIGGALAAVAAVTVGVVMVTGGDDEPSTAPTTTLEASTTVAPITTDGTTTTTESTTPVPAGVDDIAHSVVQIFAELNDGTQIWSGSGTIIASYGLILTNAHVVENNGDPIFYDRLVVYLTDRADAPPTPMYIADVVAFDPDVDLAVIQIFTDLNGSPAGELNLPALPIGDSDQIGLGDNLRILGFPGIGGETITFTQGAVSGFTSEAGVGDRAWVKTDATIAGGNSGGTAVNDEGQLVAVPTQASAGADGEITDCRVVQDTNGDGSIDQNDTCIPIGGFLNGLRPVNLAQPLIQQAQQGQIIDTRPQGGTGGEIDLESVRLGPIRFGADVDPNTNLPTAGETEILPSGAAKACAFFDYEGMVDGVKWDAVWSRDGEVVEDYSIFDNDWIGGANGIDWWVCAGNGVDPLPLGIYDLTLFVDGEGITSAVVFVGNYAMAGINVINNTSSEVCYLRLSPPTSGRWGNDEFTSEQTLPAGGTTTIIEVGAVYDVLAQDCDLNTIAEYYEVDLTAGGDLVISP